MEGIVPLIYLGALVGSIYLAWRILTKAGFNGWLSLLAPIPIANLVLLIYFALAEWPIQRNLPSRRTEEEVQEYSSYIKKG